MELKVAEPLEWAKSSNAIAVKAVYLDGKLEGGTDRAAPKDLPVGYTAATKLTAERQVGIAGYRLAALISAAMRQH